MSRHSGGPGLLRRGATAAVAAMSLTVGVAMLATVGAGAATVAHSGTKAGSGVSVVAQARGSVVSLYRTPASSKPYAVLSRPVTAGSPLVFLVSDDSMTRFWVRVYVPTRPNGSQAWVHASAVTLTSDAYRVTATIGTHTLVVDKDGRPIMTVPVGVGRSVLPTPTGTYFIVDLLRQSDATGEYGPYAFGLSAFSDVLQSFGGGPGEIGLHGTDDPSSVGGDVSHGCLRVTDATITTLAHLLPLGTPVVIAR